MGTHPVTRDPMRSVSSRIPVSSCCNPTAHGETAPKRQPHPASRSFTTTAGRYGSPANAGPLGPIRNGHFLGSRIIDSGPLADEKGDVDPFAGRDPFANAERYTPVLRSTRAQSRSRNSRSISGIRAKRRRSTSSIAEAAADFHLTELSNPHVRNGHLQRDDRLKRILPHQWIFPP